MNPLLSKRFGFLISAAIWLILSLLTTPDISGQSNDIKGVVVSESGSPIASARLYVQSPAGTMLEAVVTDSSGAFTIRRRNKGLYVLKIEADNFQGREEIIDFSTPKPGTWSIELGLSPLRNEITVTAQRGSVADTSLISAIVSIRGAEEIQSGPLPTIGNVLDRSTGIMVQQSTYGQASPFLRGLTGYQVLNLIDGVRFNNSTFRSGPNQYLAYIEPSQVQRVEAMLGPASTQYGSDALGGAIQVISNTPKFSDTDRRSIRGEVGSFAATADASFGGDASISIGTKKTAWLIGGNWRKHNDLRAGSGNDSRHVLKRFFGLDENLIRDLYGTRMQDTGFRHYGFNTRLAAGFADNQSLTIRYQQNEIDRVRAYKDLWGGLGRLRSDFEPQDLKFFYGRYEKQGLGFIDTVTGTFSINSQSDGSIRQGLRATDRTIRDESRVDSFGYLIQATTHLTDRNATVFGAEIYDEHIAAYRDETDPQTQIPIVKRALYPNGSRYMTFGIFAQDTLEVVRNRLRATLGLRYTRVGFRTFAGRNLDQQGNSLGVIDTKRTFDDLTYNAGVSLQVNKFLTLHFLNGRGFRAPNLNDLGALGLNDLGFEVPAEAAAAAGAFAGLSDGEGVASTGRKVSELRAERLFNYEFGATIRLKRLYFRSQIFDTELKDPIVRRTMLFPAGQAPAMLANVSVTPIPQTPAQAAQKMTGVATSLDPRAVKAFINEGQAKYYGIDNSIRLLITDRLSIEGNHSFLVGRELNPNRFIRRLPPQQGFISLRFQPRSRSPIDWIELSGNISGSQDRLSGGDITDERIGAARRRRDIADFFQGTLARSFISPGTDGILGSADDLFRPTNETLSQIRDRVLPVGSTINGVKILDDNTRVPLYTSTGAFASINLRAGMTISENVRLNVGLMNLLDRNYRVHGSGVDAPGLNFHFGLRYSF